MLLDMLLDIRVKGDQSGDRAPQHARLGLWGKKSEARERSKRQWLNMQHRSSGTISTGGQRRLHYREWYESRASAYREGLIFFLPCRRIFAERPFTERHQAFLGKRCIVRKTPEMIPPQKLQRSATMSPLLAPNSSATLLPGNTSVNVDSGSSSVIANAGGCRSFRLVSVSNS